MRKRRNHDAGFKARVALEAGHLELPAFRQPVCGNEARDGLICEAGVVLG